MLKPLDAPDESSRGEVTGCSSLDIRQVIAEFHRDVYRYAFRLSGNAEDAEDLTQQTFLMAHQRLHQVRDPAKVDRWLYAVLRSCYLKSVRRSRPISASSVEIDVDEIPAEPHEDGIDRQLLQMAVDDLPDRLKIVVVMFYFEHASYQQIAEALDVPMGTVMSRLSRAKGRLRQRLLRSADSEGDQPSGGLTLTSS